MGRVQQQSGDSAEVKVRDILRKNGVPNFKLKTGTNGTVFDVIASYHDVACAMEIKHVKCGAIYADNAQFRKKQDEIERYMLTNKNMYLVILFEERDFIGCIHMQKAIRSMDTLGFVSLLMCEDFNYFISKIKGLAPCAY